MAILQYYIAFLPLLIFAIFALLLFVKKWIDDHQRSKTSGDKLLRSVGDSRRVEIENIDAKINTCLIYIGIAVAFQIIGFTFLTSALNGAVLSYLLGVVSVTTVTFSLWYLIKTTILVMNNPAPRGEVSEECELSIIM